MLSRSRSNLLAYLWAYSGEPSANVQPQLHFYSAISLPWDTAFLLLCLTLPRHRSPTPCNIHLRPHRPPDPKCLAPLPSLHLPRHPRPPLHPLRHRHSLLHPPKATSESSLIRRGYAQWHIHPWNRILIFYFALSRSLDWMKRGPSLIDYPLTSFSCERMVAGRSTALVELDPEPMVQGRVRFAELLPLSPRGRVYLFLPFAGDHIGTLLLLLQVAGDASRPAVLCVICYVPGLRKVACILMYTELVYLALPVSRFHVGLFHPFSDSTLSVIAATGTYTPAYDCSYRTESRSNLLIGHANAHVWALDGASRRQQSEPSRFSDVPNLKSGDTSSVHTYIRTFGPSYHIEVDSQPETP
ncbi:hypothetical protein NMY22_g5147 [Coprinellus aureogranulatus]|nr:hypothetical protein NMY22_g5147 [Coprinellus aureogranulatus]